MERSTTIFGRDAFHSVPLFQRSFRDAVKRPYHCVDAVERVLAMKWRRA